MKPAYRKGFGFGLTSGIITTLGIIIGLDSVTHSKVAVIGGILAIAIADSLSDALGIHISEESVKNSHTKVWESTYSTAFFKFLFALLFIIPILLLDLNTAILINIAWGLAAIALYSYHLAKMFKRNRLGTIVEHTSIAIAVILITHYIGDLLILVGLQ